MPVLSPKLSEILVKSTHARDIDDALNRIISEYLDLKLSSLEKQIDQFEQKWNMDFEHFKIQLKNKTLKADSFSYDVETDYWEWEEAETLKQHYSTIKEQWI